MREWDDGGLVALGTERRAVLFGNLAAGDALVGRGKRYRDETFDDDGSEERGMLLGLPARSTRHER
jgi:hypothetical protein